VITQRVLVKNNIVKDKKEGANTKKIKNNEKFNTSISEKKQIDILNTSGLSKRKDGEWVTPEGHVVFLKN